MRPRRCAIHGARRCSSTCCWPTYSCAKPRARARTSRRCSSTQPHTSSTTISSARSAYKGPIRNPEWYVDPDEDPVFEVYALYDRSWQRCSGAFPKARLMIGTGLHQNPHSKVTFYWRLKNHAVLCASSESNSIRSLRACRGTSSVSCRSAEQAKAAERRLLSGTGGRRQPVVRSRQPRHGPIRHVRLSRRTLPPTPAFAVGDLRLSGPASPRSRSSRSRMASITGSAI